MADRVWRGRGSGQNIVVSNAVLFLVLDEIYLDIQFTEWGVGSSAGGSFSYLRAEPPSTEPTGDYNGDHVVDAADYTIWRDTLGSMIDLRANGDDTGLSAGIIDDADYDFWKAHFGESVGPGTGSSVAVPEPSVMWLTLAAAIGCFYLRRR